MRETKRFYGWPEDAQFLVPDGVREHFAAGIGERGRKLREEWESLLDGYRREHGSLERQITAMQRRELPEGWDRDIPSFEADEKGIATRKASNAVENAIAAQVPWMISGSADLTDSTSVRLTFDGAEDLEPETPGVATSTTGSASTSRRPPRTASRCRSCAPSWSTYLVFSDYARPAIRLSALMELPVIHIFTHDSIGLGEDGPTHQPVEHLASLRAIPGLDVIRPCDANEVAEAWRVAVDRTHGPVALVLTRQNVPVLDRARYASAAGLRQGGYVLADAEGGDPELILIATGSDVALAVQAYEQLSSEGVRARVVSLPSFELFDRQPEEYREGVLPSSVTARVSIEEASTLGWDRYVGPAGGDDRHAHVRLLGTAQGRAHQVRLHPRAGGRNRARGARAPVRMKPTQELHELGQSLWVDNITRTMLDDGTLQRYIDELSVTGLTSNPTIFDKAIGDGSAYDEQIDELASGGLEGEALFFELALTDLRRAAELFEPINKRTDEVDGWVSLEVSPLLADDAEATIDQARELHAKADCNVYIKIPGTEAGRTAIEESIFAGVPINVTLLFSREQYLGAAEAFMRGVERRIDAGLDPSVPSVASLFVSRWDVAVADEAPAELRNRLGIAVGKRTYRAYRELLDSERMQRLANEGARPQRLLWASTGTKDPDASDTLYVEALAAPFTVNTMPEKTLLAVADHGEVGEPLPADGGDAEDTLQAFGDAGIDVDALAARLQTEGAETFVASWRELLDTVSKQLA